MTPSKGNCWYRLDPDTDEWEEGTMHQFGPHAAHRYVALVSSASDGKLYVVPMTDVIMNTPPPAKSTK